MMTKAEIVSGIAGMIDVNDYNNNNVYFAVTFT